jgi:hypothetical protein
MGEAAMYVAGGMAEIIKSEAADDREEQQTPGKAPGPPERREPGGVEHLLRGKIPGIPG